jgi:hypothetical protein
MSPILSEVCHRTRQQVSLRLDTEVSELEEALVASHLRKCAACRAFAMDLQALTESLRAAPLEEPSVRFQLPRRPARFGVARAGTAAAAAISVVGALIVGVSIHASPSRISASDIQNAHDRLILKEQLMQDLEGTAARPARQVPRGLAAAKDATLNPTHGTG